MSQFDTATLPPTLSQRFYSTDEGFWTLKDFRRLTERDYIVKVLIETGGNISEAAQILDIERTHLHKKIQDYGIAKKEFFV